MPTDDKTPAPIGYDDILAFIKEKKSDGPCPACHAEQWLLHGAKQGTELQLMGVFAASKDKRYTGTLSCYILACNNCGFIQTFLKAIAEEWYNNKKQELNK